MQSKVFYVQDRKIGRLQYLHSFPQSGRVRSGENTLANPNAERPGIISPNEMEEATARVSDCVMNHAPQLGIVLRSYMLNHSQGHEGIEATPDVAVIVLDKFDLRRETLLLGFCPGGYDLFVRNIECLDSHTIMPRHTATARPNRSLPQPFLPAAAKASGKPDRVWHAALPPKFAARSGKYAQV